MDTEALPRGRALLGTRVAALITDYIRKQGLMEGDELPSEAKLAEEYGVSQRVVRDAFRSLSQQGVIRTRQGKRAVVSELRPVAVHSYFRLAMEADGSAIDELVEMRLALETKAAGLAAARITDRELEGLRALLEEADAVGDDLQRRVELDLAFHLGIVKAARNRFFTAVLEALSDVLANEREKGKELTEFLGETHAESDAEHKALLLGLGTRDAALAEQQMRAHLERVQRTFRGDDLE
ncbi:FadR/GntR family transcriptional regulator [Nonomuraea endophytica]|uniref:GntR family transcriptional repressor for pyruvate dehydrogenase complex n=1 Tax=Nonomuraea endophytica TaxID=714136 RepID=A0A7W8EK15_9ACTN|nr:FadR/GntR family transcriptional regulator [Nonomuraea endophytica]MBB5082148.1 GntR family transcriptional repressor for pyruvate dehydrogenase complex [Nonomuraea endophytica]